MFYTKNYAELIDDDIGELTENRVLIKTAISTISSGTERANITGDVNISVFEKFTEAVFPRYGGYSSAGEVVEVGSAVTKVKVGDRVAVSNSVHGLYNIVPETSVNKIVSDNITYNDAAMGFIASFSMAAIRKCRLEIGESALVMGLGILGLLAVQLLKAGGATPIIAVDPIAEKREKALLIAGG